MFIVDMVGRGAMCWWAIFPECVARVPVSLWGSGGWGCVCSTLRLWSQPFATVRVRTIWPCLCHYGKFFRGDHFWRFQTSRCFVSRGRRGTSWHSDVFCNVSKVVLCGQGAILLRRFQKMCCIFRGRRSTLDVSIVIFCGRRSTLDVSCCVFIANRIGRAASSGDKVANSVAGVAFCAMCWKWMEASHKTSILRLQIFRF